MSTAWQLARDSFEHERVPALVSELYAGDPATLRLISQDYNIVYRFEMAGRGAYLRICHVSLHSLPEARQVMRFLRFLADESVPVGAPIPSLAGQYIAPLPGGYFASAQHEAPGQLMSHKMLDLSVYAAWGSSLGKLHAASRRFIPDPPGDGNFPTVQQFWRNIEPTAHRASPQIQRAYRELSEWMRGLPLRDYGLTHGDYRPGNVVWDGETARTIDFDEPNFHWYIADIARALLELRDQPASERRQYRDAFMRGYRREHAIDEWWLTQLPWFMRHRGMLMYAWDLQEGASGAGMAAWALEDVGW